MQFVDKDTTFICNPQIFISKHQLLNYISLKYFFKAVFKTRYAIQYRKKDYSQKEKHIPPIHTK